MSIPLVQPLLKVINNKSLFLPAHFTASGVVIHHNHVLLVHHKRIGAWLPPGGHLEETEMPHEAAVREVFEETGVLVEALSEPVPETGKEDAFFMPQPLCLHAVKATERERAIFHLDLAYVCQPKIAGTNLPEIKAADEVHGARWVEVTRLNEWQLANNVIEVVKLAVAKLSLAILS